MPNRKRREDLAFARDSERLARALKEARNARAMSQQELATSADLAISTVRKVESNTTRDPGFFTVVALARHLGVDLDDFW